MGLKGAFGHFGAGKEEGQSLENAALELLRKEDGALWLTASRAADVPSIKPVAQPEPDAPRVASRPAGRVTPHCRFYCRWCNSILLLPHDRLGMPFGSPALRRLEVRSVATVCIGCGHVSAFSLFRGSIGYDTRADQIPMQSVGDTILVDWLKCEEPTCPFPLPLFLVREEPLTVDAARELAAGWDWTELTCQAMHRILAPLWLFDRKPHQFPAPIR